MQSKDNSWVLGPANRMLLGLAIYTAFGVLLRLEAVVDEGLFIGMAAGAVKGRKMANKMTQLMLGYLSLQYTLDSAYNIH